MQNLHRQRVSGILADHVQDGQSPSWMSICPSVETQDLAVGDNYQLTFVDQGLDLFTSKPPWWGHDSKMGNEAAVEARQAKRLLDRLTQVHQPSM